LFSLHNLVFSVLLVVGLFLMLSLPSIRYWL
jgi:hypothetical protein